MDNFTYGIRYIMTDGKQMAHTQIQRYNRVFSVHIRSLNYTKF